MFTNTKTSNQNKAVVVRSMVISVIVSSMMLLTICSYSNKILITKHQPLHQKQMNYIHITKK